MDSLQRPRPHYNLIRQNSWSGLSESSSHESLTGPLVKSNSLNGMRASAESEWPPPLSLSLNLPFSPVPPNLSGDNLIVVLTFKPNLVVDPA